MVLSMSQTFHVIKTRKNTKVYEGISQHICTCQIENSECACDIYIHTHTDTEWSKTVNHMIQGYNEMFLKV